MINRLYNIFSKTQFWAVFGGLIFFSVLIYISDEYVSHQGWLQYSGDDTEPVVTDSALGWDIFFRAWPIVVISTPITGIFIFAITALVIGATIEIDTNYINNALDHIKELDERIIESINKRLREINLLSDHYVKIEADREQAVYESKYLARRLTEENKNLKEKISKKMELTKSQEKYIVDLSEKIDFLKKTAGENLSDYLKSLEDIKVIESNKAELLGRISKYSEENKSLKHQVSDLELKLKNALSKLDRLKTRQKGSEF